jgi:hypothetical protein
MHHTVRFFCLFFNQTVDTTTNFWWTLDMLHFLKQYCHSIESNRGFPACYWNSTNDPLSTGLGIKIGLCVGWRGIRVEPADLTDGKYTLERHRNPSDAGNASFISTCQRLPHDMQVIWRYEISPSYLEHTATYFCFVSLKMTTISPASVNKKRTCYTLTGSTGIQITFAKERRVDLENVFYRSVQNTTFHIPVFCLETWSLQFTKLKCYMLC